MKIIKQLCIIFAICFAGDVISILFSLPISGSVLGMILLFILLCLKIIKPEQIEELAGFLLKNMMLLFIPVTVGIITTGSLLKGSIFSFVTVCALSTMIVMVVSGHAVQLVQKWNQKKNKEGKKYE